MHLHIILYHRTLMINAQFHFPQPVHGDHEVKQYMFENPIPVFVKGEIFTIFYFSS